MRRSFTTEKDKEKKRIYERNWYRRNKKKRLACNTRWEKANVAKFKEFKKGLSCKKCGESDPLVLQFHHKDPAKKEFHISSKLRSFSFKKIMLEVKKCIVLCLNCHVKIHHKMKKSKIKRS